jgi:hypothetical protein
LFQFIFIDIDVYSCNVSVKAISRDHPEGKSQSKQDPRSLLTVRQVIAEAKREE